MSDPNPLLQPYDLPPFSAIQAAHLVPAIQTIIAENRTATIAIIVSQTPFPTWDDLVLAMDELDARLDVTLNVIQLLGSIHRAPAWQEAIDLCHELAEQYKHEQAHNGALYQLYQRLASSPIAALFNEHRKNTLRKVLRQYHVAGAALAPEQQRQLETLNTKISALQREFLERVEGANRAWSKHIEDPSILSGLPQATLAQMSQAAQTAGLPGWLLSLSARSYHDVVTYAENRALRQEMMVAYFSRASGTASGGLTTDNESVVAVLLDARHKKAQLLGHSNFAEFALVDQMADTPEQVIAFLDHHIELARSTFAQDREQLQRYAARRGVTHLEPWDCNYFAEQIRQDAAGLSQEAFGAYFPLETVLQRLFLFTQTLFGIQIVEPTHTDTWHPDVRAFEVIEYAEPIGHLFIDPYRREGETGWGAASSLRNRRITAEGRPRTPVAILSTQLPPPLGLQPCLLDHLQLRILLHEFGHCLEHLLTAAPYQAISGMGQLSHDRSEFVSQVLEQFCFSAPFLISLSGHFQTGQPLPDAIANKMIHYAHTQTSRETASALLTGLVDFELHRTYGDGRTPHQVFVSANNKVGHLTWPDNARPVNGFEHLASDYGAKNYSYKWSGVLATQVFERLKTEGLFNPATGAAFREAFITPGDGQSLMNSLAIFLSRPLTVHQG